ncbi:MAG: LPS export ABC transporter ATP-binding protein [Armatimonadetes bacterium]|nr:LPS export ABC transporter ATP-binding protein [Armatimonadota bacterium]
MPTLSAHNLRKLYKGRAVVNDVSLQIAQGEIVGLLGTNGAGKTTSFYMMVGLVRPNGGRVTLDGKDITHLPMYQRARQGIGYLAQEPSAFRKLTAAENIMLVLEMQPGLSRRQQAERRDHLLETLHLTERRNALAQTLSGGERRRVEIARVLATRPQFILLDEPFTGIDPIHREDLQQIIADLKRQSIGVLITDHSEVATLQITDRAYIISEGEIKTAGTSVEIANDPVAQKYYLSESSAFLIRADAERRAGIVGYACEECGEMYSPEQAAEAGFRHDQDGGRLIPVRRQGEK